MPKAKRSSRRKATSRSTALSRRKRRLAVRASSRSRKAGGAKRRVAARSARRIRPAAAKRTVRARSLRGKARVWGRAVKLCPNCNAVNAMAAAVCVRCRKPITAPAAPAAKKRAAARIAAPAPAAPVPQKKSRRTALLLEALPAIVGIFGLGWFYAGNRRLGLLLLIGMLLWDAFSILVGLFTHGLTPYITIPISILVIVISCISLNKYMSEHAEVFGYY